MAESVHADPRLEFVDMDALVLDDFPPLEEWSEDHWDDAMLITRSAMIEKYTTEWIPLEQLIEIYGFEVVDGELRRRE